MRFRPAVCKCVLIIFVSVVFSLAVLAQAPSGRLQGQIIDPTGAVIPGASITLKNSSGLVVAANSGGAGEYEFRNLVPGKYSVSVTAKGFAPVTQEIEITAGLKKTDITLQILVKEEHIDVQSDAAKVSTASDNNASSVVLTGKDLDALSDDPDELQSELQALAGPSAGPNGGQIYIDGFTGGQLPPKSSIREIRINQNPFSAQYDRMGFGRIEILTKPGSDKLHGQFFFNDNHSFWDALNPFGGPDQPEFSTQLYNANVGGPISKKASYQISVERRDINEAAVILPDAFSAANIPVVPVLNPRVRTNFSSRVDYQLAASNTLMVRYQYTRDTEENNGVSQLSLPSQAYNQNGTENEIQVSDTQILSSHAINETRFEWERGDTSQRALSSDPTVNVLGQFVSGGNPLGLNSIITNHYELQNYTSINKGNHFLRLGGRLRATTNSTTSIQNFNGTFVFGATKDPTDPTGKTQISSLANFNAKRPTQFSIVTGNPLTEDTFFDVGLYAEDDWKIHPNMTLSYGLRFETQNGINDHGDWAPRIGFAWGLGGKKNSAPKTVIRTGFGLFYDRFAQNLIMQTERLNGVNQHQITITDPGDNSPASLAKRAVLQQIYSTYPILPDLSAFAAVPSNIYTIDPNLRAPYTIQFAGSLERQITKAATLTGTYIHSHGVHQLFSQVVSTLPLQYQFESGGVFNQNQLITNFNLRASARLTIFSFYMFSHANSDTAGANSFPSDPVRGIAADYGRAAFDVRHRLFLGGTVSLPHGFRVSPFMVANSGAPFNITTGQDLNGDSIFNDRPSFGSDRQTEWGAFNPTPGPADPRIPINLGTSPAQFTLNLRVGKTFGIGPKVEATNNNNAQQQGGPRGGMPPGGGRPGGGEGGRGPGGGGGFGGPRGGGGGPFGGPERSNQRYSLTFSANARNVFNKVNPAPPIGNLSSNLFGTSTALAGGVFNTQSANRRIDFQVMFAF